MSISNTNSVHSYEYSLWPVIPQGLYYDLVLHVWSPFLCYSHYFLVPNYTTTQALINSPLLPEGLSQEDNHSLRFRCLTGSLMYNNSMAFLLAIFCILPTTCYTETLLTFPFWKFIKPTECLATLCLWLHHPLHLTLVSAPKKRLWQLTGLVRFLNKVPPFAKVFSEHIPLESSFWEVCNMPSGQFCVILTSNLHPNQEHKRLCPAVKGLWKKLQAKTETVTRAFQAWKENPNCILLVTESITTFHPNSAKILQDWQTSKWASCHQRNKGQPAPHSSHFSLLIKNPPPLLITGSR